MASTETIFQYALKERYTGQQVQDLTFKNHVLLSKLPKDESFSGDVMPLPVITSNPQGIALSLATAQTVSDTAASGNVKGYKFNITTGTLESEVSIGNKVLESSRDDKGAFIRNELVEIDGMLANFGTALSQAMYGNGGNSLGVLSGAPSANVCTLTNPEDAINLEEGMQVEFYTTDGTTSGTLRTVGGEYITDVDYVAGTFTISATPSGTTTSDHVFRRGTHGQTASAELIYGLSAWIPASAPSSTAFFGVDRTGNVTRLGGVRLTTAEVAGMGIEERLQRLCTRIQRVGSGSNGVTDIFLNPEKWQNLAIALQSRHIFSKEEKVGSFGYQALKLVAGGGEVNVWADRHCPIAKAFALDMSTWKLYSTGAAPHILDKDGNKMLRKATTNDFAVRAVAYPQLGCNNPGANGTCAV